MFIKNSFSQTEKTQKLHKKKKGVGGELEADK